MGRIGAPDSDAAQAVMDALARAAPDDSRYAMLTEFVDTYLGAGDLTRARSAAEQSLAIMRQLAASDPGKGWRHSWRHASPSNPGQGLSADLFTTAAATKAPPEAEGVAPKAEVAPAAGPASSRQLLPEVGGLHHRYERRAA